MFYVDFMPYCIFFSLDIILLFFYWIYTQRSWSEMTGIKLFNQYRFPLKNAFVNVVRKMAAICSDLNVLNYDVYSIWCRHFDLHGNVYY